MLRFAANLDTLFGEVSFLERFARARAAGFDGVECASPYAHPKAALAEQLERHSLEQVLLHLPPSDWARGDRGIACLPERRGEFRDGIGLAIEYASALGCKRVCCWAGIPVSDSPVTGSSVARSPVASSPASGVAAGGAAAGTAPKVSSLDTFVDNMRFAAAALGKAGMQLLIEPINTRDVPGFFLSQSAQALSVIEATQSDNVWLAYDVYHMQVMQGYLVEDIRRCFPKIAHFQIADNPGRHQPGTGEIDYGVVLRLIEQLGYTGWVGCEYTPVGTSRDAVAWLHTYRRGMNA